MEQLGDIVIEKTINYRNPIELKEQPEYDIVLNENQRKVSEAIKETMDFKKKRQSECASYLWNYRKWKNRSLIWI